MVLKVAQPGHLLVVLVLLQDFLVIVLGQHKSDNVRVCNDGRTAYPLLKLISHGRLANYCICTDEGNSIVATLRRQVRLFVEDVDTAIPLIYQIHAVANVTLVHQRITLHERLTHKLVNQRCD